VPGARHITLPGLGHFAPCDDPVGFGDAIVPILDEIIERVSDPLE
jgi:pimeloyl-ACP methyl ester carboxylesterase